MALKLSEVIESDAPHLNITNSRTLRQFYDAVKDAVIKNTLNREGNSDFSTFNHLLTKLPGNHKPLKNDVEIIDISLSNDEQWRVFLETWKAEHTPKVKGKKGYKPSPLAAPLYQAAKKLVDLRQGKARKEELEKGVDDFLTIYALSTHALKLPNLGINIPKALPEGFAIDKDKVTLGTNKQGNYVGLIPKMSGGDS